MFDIVGSGNPATNYSMYLKEYPKLGVGGRLAQNSWQIGGRISGGLAAAQRLGAKCAALAVAGDDLFGRFCKEELAHIGVNVDGVLVREKARTSLVVALSEMETNTVTRMIKKTDIKQMAEDELPADILKNAKYYVMFENDEVWYKAAAVAKAAGAKVVYAAPYGDDTCLDGVDIFIGPATVDAKAIAAKGVKTVVLNDGVAACCGIDDGKEFSGKVPGVTVFDTIGTDEVFAGAFLAALDGRTAAQAAEYALAAAAIHSTVIGEIAGTPTPDLVEQFLKDGTFDAAPLQEQVDYYFSGLDHVSH